MISKDQYRFNIGSMGVVLRKNGNRKYKGSLHAIVGHMCYTPQSIVKQSVEGKRMTLSVPVHVRLSGSQQRKLDQLGAGKLNTSQVIRKLIDQAQPESKAKKMSEVQDSQSAHFTQAA